MRPESSGPLVFKGHVPERIVFRMVKNHPAHTHFQARLPHPEFDVFFTLSREPDFKGDETHASIRIQAKGRPHKGHMETGRYLKSGRATASVAGEFDQDVPMAADILENQSRRFDKLGEFLRAHVDWFELHAGDRAEARRCGTQSLRGFESIVAWLDELN